MKDREVERWSKESRGREGFGRRGRRERCRKMKLRGKKRERHFSVKWFVVRSLWWCNVSCSVSSHTALVCVCVCVCVSLTGV